MIVKVSKPARNPHAMWLVHAEGQKHPTLLRLGDVPQHVQDAVHKMGGRAYFEATIEKKKVKSWGARQSAQKW